jgi:putative FmdB family regulatory protein
MPTYDYRCQACDHEFEEFQSITAKSLRKCPECGRLKLKRLIGIGAGVIFKGSGFYETDYRSESYKKDAKAAADKEKGKSTSDGDSSKPASDATKKTEPAAKKSGSDTAKKQSKPASDS